MHGSETPWQLMGVDVQAGKQQHFARCQAMKLHIHVPNTSNTSWIRLLPAWDVIGTASVYTCVAPQVVVRARCHVLEFNLRAGQACASDCSAEAT